MRRQHVLQGIAGSLATFALAALATAAGPDVLVTDAKIEAGMLVITGKTAAARTHVRLEGRSQAAFNTISGRDRTFRFDLVYLPKDCIVSLQKVQGSQPGEATDAVIANCAPSAITARGAWNEKTSYDALDLVSHGGASWLAMRKKANGEPGKSSDWQLFAAAAIDGRTGARGPGNSAWQTGTGLGSTGGLGSAAAPTGPAGGDLTGTYPNPSIAAGAVVTGHIAAGAVTTRKIKVGAIVENRIADGAVTGPKIAPLAIDGSHIQPNSITSVHIATDAVGATEIANDSIDFGEIVDFGLTNQDIGVLFAEVSAAGVLDNSSGGVSVSKLAGLGSYEVDFGRNVSFCTAVATIGPSGTGSSSGEINVADRFGNVEAVFVDTNNSDGTAADKPFRLVVVC